MKKTNHILLLFSISAGVLLLSGCTGSPVQALPEVVQVQDASQNHITVSGSEKVKVVPDIADIEFGITTQSVDASTCQKENNTEANRVLELLKNSGIAENSIQTNGYSLSPRYDWSDNKQVIIGYEMTTNITVTALAIDQVGTLINDSVNSGINYIASISYRCSSYDTSYQEALKLAIQSAAAKAQAMAAASGKSLGTVSGMEEIRPNQNFRYANYASGAAKEDASAGMAVMPGEVDVEAEVVVTFELH